MQKYFVFLLALFLISACATGPLTAGRKSFDKESAYVIVALQGSMPISEARFCNGICTAWYSFGSDNVNGVHIFKKRIGTTFEINTLYSTAFSVMYKGNKIKISSPGVYYYGVIHSHEGKLHYSPEPNKEVIKKILDKYGEDLQTLTPVGFYWPGKNQ